MDEREAAAKGNEASFVCAVTRAINELLDDSGYSRMACVLQQGLAVNPPGSAQLNEHPIPEASWRGAAGYPAYRA